MTIGRQDGFSMILIILIFGTFSVAVTAIMTFSQYLHRPAIRNMSEVLEIKRNSISQLVRNGAAWTRTLAANNIVQPTPNALTGAVELPQSINPAVTPLSVPPLLTPPFTVTSGGLFNLVDGNGMTVVESLAQQVGFTLKGERCTGFSATQSSPECPLRYETRWHVATNATNPLVMVQVTLRVSPDTVTVNPELYSYDTSISEELPVPIRKPSNPILRGLFPSWMAHGLIDNSPDPRLAYLDLSGVPNCPAGAAGAFCAPAGSVCICPTVECVNGRELFRCQ